MIRICLNLALTLLLIGCASPQADEPQVLTIGVVAPFSGDYAPLGQSVRDAVLIAAEEWNLEGGVLDYEIQVVLEDAACDYQTGRGAAEAAIDKGAPLIIGAVCAKASEGVAQIAMREGVLQITPGAVNLDLTLDIDGEVRPLVYRIPSVDDDQGRAMARFAQEQLGSDTAAVLYAEESAYGAALAQAFVEAFEAADGEVLDVETYDPDAELFFEALDGAREASPDVLYLPGYHTVANTLVAQARQYGLLMTFLGSDGWHSAALDRDATLGAYITTHYFPEEPGFLLSRWVRTYEERYLAAPDALATMSYDAANLLFTAIEAAATTDPVLVAQAMEGITYEGVAGTFTFDEAHNPVRSVIVMRVDTRGFVYQGRYAP